MATHPNYITASPSGTVRVLSTDQLVDAAEPIRAVTSAMRRFMPNACGDWADTIDAALPHTAVEQACKAAVFQTIATARADTTRVAVGAYSSLERTAKNLPAHLQLSLIRAVLPNLIGYGVDLIERGCDTVESDLRDETRANDEPQYGWRAS